MAYKQDSSNKICSGIYTNSEEVHRLSYYCNIPRDKATTLYEYTALTPQQSFFENIVHFQNIPGMHYFFRLAGRNENEILFPSYEKWKKIGSFYTSKRKKDELILYSYTPGCENISEWNLPIPEIEPDNIYRLMDFEQEGKKKEIDLLKHRTGKENTEKKTIFLPSGWGMDYDSNNPAKIPIVTLSHIAPLAGKQSLLLEASPATQPAGVYSNPYPINPYHFSLYVRGVTSPETNLQVQVRCYYGNEGKYYIIKRMFFNVLQNKTYHIFWDMKQYPTNGEHITVLFYASKGSILLDQFSIEKTY